MLYHYGIFSQFRNTVGLESNEGVNVAVLAFEKQHLALDIQMDIQIASIKNQLHAFCWNCVGPSALSDALKRVCDEDRLQVHAKDRCQQIDIQPSFVFYPIEYQVRIVKCICEEHNLLFFFYSKSLNSFVVRCLPI